MEELHIVYRGLLSVWAPCMYELPCLYRDPLSVGASCLHGPLLEATSLGPLTLGAPMPVGAPEKCPFPPIGALLPVGARNYINISGRGHDSPGCATDFPS